MWVRIGQEGKAGGKRFPRRGTSRLFPGTSHRPSPQGRTPGSGARCNRRVDVVRPPVDLSRVFRDPLGRFCSLHPLPRPCFWGREVGSLEELSLQRSHP